MPIRNLVVSVIANRLGILMSNCWSSVFLFFLLIQFVVVWALVCLGGWCVVLGVLWCSWFGFVWLVGAVGE